MKVLLQPFATAISPGARAQPTTAACRIILLIFCRIARSSMGMPSHGSVSLQYGGLALLMLLGSAQLTARAASLPAVGAETHGVTAQDFKALARAAAHQGGGRSLLQNSAFSQDFFSILQAILTGDSSSPWHEVFDTALPQLSSSQASLCHCGDLYLQVAQQQPSQPPVQLATRLQSPTPFPYALLLATPFPRPEQPLLQCNKAVPSRAITQQPLHMFQL